MLLRSSASIPSLEGWALNVRRWWNGFPASSPPSGRLVSPEQTRDPKPIGHRVTLSLPNQHVGCVGRSGIPSPVVWIPLSAT